MLIANDRSDTMIKDMLEFNKKFVENKEYEPYRTSKFPDKKLAIVTCMDTRLTNLLPAALGLKNGDAKIIKNAGGVITHPFGSVVRSLLVAIYELGVQDICIIGHTDCGVQHMNSEDLLLKMKQRGISEEKIALAQDFGIDLHHFLKGFDDVETSVKSSIALLQKHPLIPEDVHLYGFILDSVSGELFEVK